MSRRKQALVLPEELIIVAFMPDVVWVSMSGEDRECRPVGDAIPFPIATEACVFERLFRPAHDLQ